MCDASGCAQAAEEREIELQDRLAKVHASTLHDKSELERVHAAAEEQATTAADKTRALQEQVRLLLSDDELAMLSDRAHDTIRTCCGRSFLLLKDRGLDTDRAACVLSGQVTSLDMALKQMRNANKAQGCRQPFSSLALFVLLFFFFLSYMWPLSLASSCLHHLLP